MTTLTEQIEQMRLQIRQVASDEQALIKELADALRHADERLLREMRLAAAEHEVRRCTILRELEMLASRFAALPQPRNPTPAIEDALRRLVPHAPDRRPQLRQAPIN